MLKIHRSAPAAVLDGELPPVAAELLSSAAAAVVRPLPLVSSPSCVLSLSLFPGHGGHGVRRRRGGVPAPGRGGQSPSPWARRPESQPPGHGAWLAAARAPGCRLLLARRSFPSLACGVAGLRAETVAMAARKGAAWAAARAGSHGRVKEVAMAARRRWSWPLFFSLVDEMSCTRSRPLFFLVAMEVKERRRGQQGGRRP